MERPGIYHTKKKKKKKNSGRLQKPIESMIHILLKKKKRKEAF